MSRKTYAVAETVPAWCDYITAGKRYEVIEEAGEFFVITADDGYQLECCWVRDPDLGGNWTRIEADEPDWRAIAETLAGALEPFAICTEQIAISEPDDEWAKFRLVIADYRKAASALAAFNAAKGEGE